jgi:hypothetical protein
VAGLQAGKSLNSNEEEVCAFICLGAAAVEKLAPIRSILQMPEPAQWE